MNEIIKTNTCCYCGASINKQPTDNTQLHNVKDDGFCSAACYYMYNDELQKRETIVEKIELLAEKLFIERVNRECDQHGRGVAIIDKVFNDVWVAAKRFYELVDIQEDKS